MTSKFHIAYYISPSGDNPVSDFLDSLSINQQSKILRLFQHITEYGLIAVQSHIKKFRGTSLWEIRILGKDNLRILYAVLTENTIMVLHGFNKKTQKTPPREIKNALTRYDEWHRRKA